MTMNPNVTEAAGLQPTQPAYPTMGQPAPLTAPTAQPQPAPAVYVHTLQGQAPVTQAYPVMQPQPSTQPTPMGQPTPQMVQPTPHEGGAPPAAPPPLPQTTVHGQAPSDDDPTLHYVLLILGLFLCPILMPVSYFLSLSAPPEHKRTRRVGRLNCGLFVAWVAIITLVVVLVVVCANRRATNVGYYGKYGQAY